MTKLVYIHEQPCCCTSCEGTRERAYSGPGLYKSIPAHRDPKRPGTVTWTLRRFEWGEYIHLGELVWVERLVTWGEPGFHLKGAVIWVLDGGANRFSKPSELCTSLRWLEPA